MVLFIIISLTEAAVFIVLIDYSCHVLVDISAIESDIREFRQLGESEVSLTTTQTR